MDLQNLKWTKNVKRGDRAWAYSQFKVDNLFKLEWKDNETNANKPKKGDLILLRQKGYVTHLVKVLDYKAEREDLKDDWNIYRIVEVVWTINFDNPSRLAKVKAEIIFDYPEVLDYQSGDAMELESLPTFTNHWDTKGGLIGFQTHIQSLLALPSDG